MAVLLHGSVGWSFEVGWVLRNLDITIDPARQFSDGPAFLGRQRLSLVAIKMQMPLL